uniref:Hemopexin n=1 Tax=Varanus komodoensis TaxID=61221 RepID=A0A8D2LQR5_VARKO
AGRSRGAPESLGLSETAQPLCRPPPPRGQAPFEGAAQPLLQVVRRCADETGFDAVTLDEGGTMLFFKGDLVWKGFTGRAEPINASWPDVGGPVDAALRIHHVGERLWAYAQGKLRPGYPRLIGEEFKGVPSNLDAAVECHPKECQAETILFFKDTNVFSYDLQTGQVKLRSWPAISHCTAAVRWLDHYYCFQNIHFLRFNPVTGEVPPNYSRDARDYFMRCPGRGESTAPSAAPAGASRQAVPDPGVGPGERRAGSVCGG